MINSFSIAALPKIEFARGSLEKLPQYIAQYGDTCLIVTGAKSFIQSELWPSVQQQLDAAHIQWQQVSIQTEPSPTLIDDLAREYRGFSPHVVVGIGGGSALDGAKALSGLLKIENSVLDFLEGVGPELPYDGPAVPMIAVPTTAGTGSEATKNAVLSHQDLDRGYKKSFRSELLIPKLVLIDANLLKSCPSGIIAANGMDALTQLMESFVSIKANALTDALALSGIEQARDSLSLWFHQGAEAEQAQESMAYAALLSGICLAQTGLGSVHGLASPLGAFYPIPHGVVCGTLVAEATRQNICAMRSREKNNPNLAKYEQLARVLTQRPRADLEDLLGYLDDLTVDLNLPLLGDYGVTEEHIPHIVAHSRGSSMKTNPIVLTDLEIDEIVRKRI